MNVSCLEAERFDIELPGLTMSDRCPAGLHLPAVVGNLETEIIDLTLSLEHWSQRYLESYQELLPSRMWSTSCDTRQAVTAAGRLFPCGGGETTHSFVSVDRERPARRPLAHRVEPLQGRGYATRHTRHSALN